MVAYFSGVVQAPITAFVIVLEMTDSSAMTVPLMAAALIGYGTSRVVDTPPVYHPSPETACGGTRTAAVSAACGGVRSEGQRRFIFSKCRTRSGWLVPAS